MEEKTLKQKVLGILGVASAFILIGALIYFEMK